MKFKKYVVHETEHWVCGIYKITKYDYLSAVEKKVHYAAYFIPEHFKGWCNHVDRATPHYFKLKDAMEACEKHLKINPEQKHHKIKAEKALASFLA